MSIVALGVQMRTATIADFIKCTRARRTAFVDAPLCTTVKDTMAFLACLPADSNISTAGENAARTGAFLFTFLGAASQRTVAAAILLAPLRMARNRSTRLALARLLALRVMRVRLAVTSVRITRLHTHLFTAHGALSLNNGIWSLGLTSAGGAISPARFALACYLAVAARAHLFAVLHVRSTAHVAPPGSAVLETIIRMAYHILAPTTRAILFAVASTSCAFHMSTVALSALLDAFLPGVAVERAFLGIAVRRIAYLVTVLHSCAIVSLAGK